MAKRDEIFPSKYLKASDLAGKPFAAETERAPTERWAAATMRRKKPSWISAAARSRCRSI